MQRFQLPRGYKVEGVMCIVWFIKSQYALVKNVWGLLILESVFKLQYGRERKVKSLEEKKRFNWKNPIHDSCYK